MIITMQYGESDISAQTFFCVIVTNHDDVIKWKYSPCYLPFVTSELSSQRPVMRNFDVFFDLRLNKRLSKQWRRRWFEMSLRSIWRHGYERMNICTHDHVAVDTATVFWILR